MKLCMNFLSVLVKVHFLLWSIHHFIDQELCDLWRHMRFSPDCKAGVKLRRRHILIIQTWTTPVTQFPSLVWRPGLDQPVWPCPWSGTRIQTCSEASLCRVQRSNSQLTVLWNPTCRLASAGFLRSPSSRRFIRLRGGFQTPAVSAVTLRLTIKSESSMTSSNIESDRPAKVGVSQVSAATSIMADNYDGWGRSSGKWRPENI